MKKIAIQGIHGSFHDIAAHQYFANEQIQLDCCATFEELFEHTQLDPTAIGVLAIENTIAGSLLITTSFCAQVEQLSSESTSFIYSIASAVCQKTIGILSVRCTLTP